MKSLTIILKAFDSEKQFRKPAKTCTLENIEQLGRRKAGTEILARLIRPKARGLAQHGGLSCWQEESDPAGCDFVRDRRSMPPALTDGPHHLTRSRADLLLNLHKNLMSYVTQGRHGLVLQETHAFSLGATLGTVFRISKCFQRTKQKLLNYFSLSQGSLTISKLSVHVQEVLI